MAAGRSPNFCYACWQEPYLCGCYQPKVIKMKQSNETSEGFKACATEIVERLDSDFEKFLGRKEPLTDEEKQHLSNALKLYMLENLHADTVVQACVSIHLKLGIKDG